MEFAVDGKAIWIALIFVLAFILLRRVSMRYPAPRLFFSDLKGLKEVGTGWRLRWASFSRWMLYGALAAFIVGYLDPQVMVPRKGAQAPSREVVEGIAIYLVLDQSGSMADRVMVYNAEGGREQVAKIDLLKGVTAGFVKGRPNDMIGLVALARGANVLAPLTLDHQAILDKIAHLSVLTNPEEGGTVIGYAIFKTANLIAAMRQYAMEQHAYSIKSHVIILVTDGLQDPNPLDEKKPLRMIEVPEAAEYARQAGVKVYIVDIDPSLGSQEFAAARHQMQNAAELTGGKYYLVQGTKGLAEIYSEIDKLEKSALPTIAEATKEEKFDSIPLFPYLISMGLLALYLSLLFEATLLRRAP